MIEHAMLSRVAANLFWIGRYMERSDNVARLADAARRIEAMPGETAIRSSDWASALIAAGTQPDRTTPFDVSRKDAIETLFFDEENPSSVRNCLFHARENAREVRTELTQEVWEALNGGWRDYRVFCTATNRKDLANLIDWVKTTSAQVRGAVNGSLLRNDGYIFLKLGQSVERIDATARLIDVKYHVLLPDADAVGKATDRAHWHALLQAASSERAYTHATKAHVSGKGVARFLILAAENPRSILFNARVLRKRLHDLERYYEADAKDHEVILDFANRFEKLTIEEIIQEGLHEFLTKVIEQNYAVADAIAKSYGFAPAIEDSETNVEQTQTQ